MKKHRLIPYPGLRPFTEEEAVFFKGRDQHIHQIISQLQERKIVIVTGASGDGKSSLIYAGVIPNARAGFFKTTFNQWVIADFRPERTPLHNLSTSLAAGLGLEVEEVYNELQFGFSSLVNIYKQSKFFVDFSSEAWKNASDEERKQMRSSAANLLIIADQFEEFFTNPENFAAGKPSIEAYTTVNLLLETARIALRENLPVYIIFTMRSDFISDCVAFKGLPEFIGFSQFFVPRLRRTELRQVIEEPARLAGGRVANRLTEILINELHEGHDQLPVLQHALNRLWRAANYGEEELDLIHLAKIGGIPPEYLDDKDREEFQQWFEQLDVKQKVYFVKASLNNVLNLHANTLYDSAFDYFMEKAPWAEKNISEEQAKEILKICFLGLTRIDDGRAVRNRMSLRELTNLVNLPNISFEHVNGLINIFREPDSTFIRPFINPDDVDTQYISPDIVLDITHEALIRNWELLKQWEKEEEENYNDFQEFMVQLKRWLDSGKKTEYLLPLGPLTYFEAWYERCKPNKYWLAKNDRTELDTKKKLRKAEELEQNIREFLTHSRRHIEAIERRKKRLRKTLGLFALIVIILLSGLTAWAIREKKNADIQRRVAEEQRLLAEKQKAIAEQQKNEAIRANKIAEQQRIRAEKEALKALKEKRKADSLLQVALKLKAIAEQQRQKAIEEAMRAMREKQKADSLRVIAEEQKQKAIEASNRANRLSIISLAQSLAYKAIATYKDPQTNLLLAYYAYYLNKANGGDENNPEIYKGLFNVFRKLSLQRYTININNIKSIYPLDSQTVYYMTKNYKIGKVNLSNGKKSLIHITKRGGGGSAPIQYVWWNQRDTILMKDAYGALWFVSISSKQMKRIIKKIENVKFVDFVMNGDLLVFTRNQAIFYRKNKNHFVSSNEFNLKMHRIQTVISNDTRDVYYIISKTGKIVKLNPFTEELNIVLDLKLNELILSAAALSKDEHYLALGDGKGNVYIIDLIHKKLVQQFSLASATVRALLFDSDNKHFYVLCPDNTLNIFRVGKYTERPISFSPVDSKINDLYEEGNLVIGLDESQNIFWVYPKADFYAKIIKEHIKRNFTNEEWKLFFQDVIPYSDTIQLKHISQ